MSASKNEDIHLNKNEPTVLSYVPNSSKNIIDD